MFQSTPPERGATQYKINVEFVGDVSIHAPREGSDEQRNGRDNRNNRFQSTPPERGATGWTCNAVITSGVSIHAPREGSDSSLHPGLPG